MYYVKVLGNPFDDNFGPFLCGHTDQKFRDLVTQLQQLTEENQMIRKNRIQLNRQLHQKVGAISYPTPG
jgi:hypothetical protein